MKIEAGKYYKTRDGRKVGPMVRDQKTETPYVWDAGVTGLSFTKRGEVFEGVEGRGDLIAEWTDTPKLWRDMTPAEKGALLLAHHEGKVIEYSYGCSDIWRKCAANEPVWEKGAAYRVKPADPVVETVTLHMDDAQCVTRGRCSGDTHTITFNLIDGKPDCDSIRMEEL